MGVLFQQKAGPLFEPGFLNRMFRREDAVPETARIVASVPLIGWENSSSSAELWQSVHGCGQVKFSQQAK